jgi:hypothetical protein
VIRYSRLSTSIEKMDALPYCDSTIDIRERMFIVGMAAWARTTQGVRNTNSNATNVLFI